MIRFFFAFIFITNQVCALELKGTFEQGSLIIGKTNPSNEIYVDQKKLKVSKEGYFVFGISRDRKKNISISIGEDNKASQVIKSVKSRKFKVQKIDGLPKRKVSPNNEDMKRIRKEGKLIAKAKNVNSDLSFFFKDFIRPVDGITTGVFGSQRVLNGKPRRPHYGIDIAAAKGTKIKNSNSGNVLLAANNLFFTGGTIIIEHGHGLISIYSHLDKIFVKKGDFVKKGELIATVGSTGRSTGPHLDFRLYCRNIPVDPDLVIKKN
ncbi:M23 family metallopeptidase [Candidatus Pelagibacter sp. HIMB1517]|uniref:M23 family metallopeptidase n=1 Tax=Candidatus Pelagibacter sp. HIMB1517 TaxID=3413341 RepID=UPI003F85CB93